MIKTYRQSVLNDSCFLCNASHIHDMGTELEPDRPDIKFIPARERKKDYVLASSIPTIAENILTELDGYTDRTTKEIAVSIGIYHGRATYWLDILRARGSVVSGPRRRCEVEGRRVGTWQRNAV